MKFSMRLSLLLSIYGLAVFAAGMMIGHAPFGGSGDAERIVLLIAGVCLVLIFASMVAYSVSRRIAVLAERAALVRQYPMLHTVELPGPRDELRRIAQSINGLREQLTRGEEARNQLVADVAHELRTPVAILRGHLETMLTGAEEAKPENLLPLLDETKRMSRLLQEMRDLNLAEAGRLTLDRAWVNLGSVLREVTAIMSLEAESKEALLTLEGEWEGEVYCDAARMKQVLINLVGNAVRYVPAGGEVRVAYREEAGAVRITVADNGPGIPEEKLPYLFKRFYRVESSRSRSSGGTGLGLAIAKQYMEAHGGSIDVASIVGAGTQFTLRLPIFPLEDG